MAIPPKSILIVKLNFYILELKMRCYKVPRISGVARSDFSSV